MIQGDELDDIPLRDNIDPTPIDREMKDPNIDIDTDAIEKHIFKQISNQLAQVANSVQIGGVSQEVMSFKIENTEKCAYVSRCQSNGSCLFQAMAHQLHIEDFNSAKQNASTKKLRKDVVKLIKEDMDAYKLQLNNTIYERMSQEEVDEMANMSKNDLNEALAKQRRQFVNYQLPKFKTWGGSESMLAISKLHKVNILVFSEDESFYYNNFNLQYDR